MAMRLDKLLAHYGIGTRKEVNTYIRKGYVQVNGQIIKKDDFKVDYEKDQILFDGQPINYKPYVYLMLNKPSGYVSATKDNVHPTVVDLIKGYHQYDLFPVGRLDYDTTGLLIMTNDGVLSNKILEADNLHEKEYIVTVDKIINDDFINKMASGVDIGDAITRKCKVSKISDDTFNIVLTQGLNKQIRRMTKAFGYTVIKLERIRIMNIKIDDIEYGQWRKLTSRELEKLKELTSYH